MIKTSAEVKYQFPGIAKFNALLLFTALGSSPAAFLTNGLLGKFVYFFLNRFGNWLANQGLALANMGVDALIISEQHGNYEQVMDEAFEEIKKKKGRLSPEERKKIDDKVKDAFREFAPFTR